MKRRNQLLPTGSDMAQMTTAYKTSEPNVDIVRYTGPITLSKDADQITTEGTFVLQGLPAPRVRLLLNRVPSNMFALFNRWTTPSPPTGSQIESGQ
jgi:hypothetical protein